MNGSADNVHVCKTTASTHVNCHLSSPAFTANFNQRAGHKKDEPLIKEKLCKFIFIAQENHLIH